MIRSLFPVRNMAGFLSVRRHQAVTGFFSSLLVLLLVQPCQCQALHVSGCQVSPCLWVWSRG